MKQDDDDIRELFSPACYAHEWAADLTPAPKPEPARDGPAPSGAEPVAGPSVVAQVVD
jgi:hypothetical protein